MTEACEVETSEESELGARTGFVGWIVVEKGDRQTEGPDPPLACPQPCVSDPGVGGTKALSGGGGEITCGCRGRTGSRALKAQGSLLLLDPRSVRLATGECVQRARRGSGDPGAFPPIIQRWFLDFLSGVIFPSKRLN